MVSILEMLAILAVVWSRNYWWRYLLSGVTLCRNVWQDCLLLGADGEIDGPARPGQPVPTPDWALIGRLGDTGLPLVERITPRVYWTRARLR